VENNERLQEKQNIIKSIIKLNDNPKKQIITFMFVLLSCEVVLLILHLATTTYLSEVAIQTEDGHIGGFDLNDEGNIAVWFSSMQLLLIALICYAMSLLDSEKTFTMSNRQFWKFSFFLYVWMSLDETGGLHELFGQGMVKLFPFLGISAKLWWTIPYALLLGGVISFLLLRFRNYLNYLSAVLAFALCWFIANIFEHFFVFPTNINVAIEEGFEMLGATILLVLLAFFISKTVNNKA
jgi:hypothetical protein